MTNLSEYDASEILTPKGEIGLIGCGSSGRIRYCKNKKLGYFAVKCLALPGNTSGVEDKKKELLKEATVLQKLTHKNIIQVHGITFWSHSIGIITDYFPIGNLDDLLTNKLIKIIIWLLRLRIAFEVSEALCFLHYYKPSKVLVHGDLKPQNIMLTEDLRVKLADFGSVSLVACTGASSLSTPISANTQHTPYYTAPEFLKDFNKPRTAAMDVYSYSMVLYEILTRERVYGRAKTSMDIVVSVIISRDTRPDEKLTSVVRDGLKSADLEIFNSLEKVMKESWVRDPNERPQITCIRDQLYNLLKIFADPKELGEHICETVNCHQSSVKSQLSEFEKCEYISLDHFAHPYEKVLVEINTKQIVQKPSMPTQVVEDVASVKKPEMVERKTSPGMFLVCGSAKPGQPYQLSKFVFETKDFDTISKFYINWEGNAIVSIGNMVFLLGPVIYSLNTEDKDPHWIKVRSMNKPRAHFKAVVAAAVG
ncbi:receptor-interacting serine/threonine-protein kinase 2-like isoform X2 [Clavelina lepadiformis]|uniref:receptor-interacting serine/threonine-protein kinase 2-like isoform X2 n=1 Tax=Clavelina lepadiformis TaxID=159417 RepID=UPI004041B31A